MSNLSALAAALEQEVKLLPAKSNAAAKQVTSAIIQDLALHTPVDQGTALSNWQVTLEEPASGILPAAVPSKKGKMTGGKFQHAIAPDVTREANASVVLENANTVIDAKQPGQPIFITNNVAYIQELNDGTSDQAPAGFVDRAAILAQSVVDTALKFG